MALLVELVTERSPDSEVGRSEFVPLSFVAAGRRRCEEADRPAKDGAGGSRLAAGHACKRSPKSAGK